MDNKIYTAVEIIEFEGGTKFKSVEHGLIVEVDECGDNKFLKGQLSEACLYFTTNLLKSKFTKIEGDK